MMLVCVISNDPAEMRRFAAGRQVAEYTNDAKEDLRNYDYQALILTSGSAQDCRGQFEH